MKNQNRFLLATFATAVAAAFTVGLPRAAHADDVTDAMPAVSASFTIRQDGHSPVPRALRDGL